MFLKYVYGIYILLIIFYVFKYDKNLWCMEFLIIIYVMILWINFYICNKWYDVKGKDNF